MLGMYVHTHWGYKHPYCARTWTLDDWRGYLTGLSSLGYDCAMVWPQLDCMPPEPTDSDRAWLATLAAMIDFAHDELGMKVVMIVCANTIGNDRAAEFTFAERPYFVCETRIDPGDADQMAAFLAGRRNQLQPIAAADALAIIDSDPGGYPGSTNEQFGDLVVGQVEIVREFNPGAEFVYWMLMGWEPYNRFWAQWSDSGHGDWPSPTADDFRSVLEIIRDRVGEPWWLFASSPAHNEAIDSLGLRDRAMWFPYALIEGEPTFPLTNCHVDKLTETLTADELARYPRGLMGNSQTHCLQLPLTYAFAQLARDDEIDLPGFAERLLPGLGETIAAAWQAVESPDPQLQRAAAKDIQDAVWDIDGVGDLGGLLFGIPERFLTDLAMNLEVRAALTDLRHISDSGGEVHVALRAALDVLIPYQQRLGFVDACGGVIDESFLAVLAKLDDADLNIALTRSRDWRNPTVRNGALADFLAASEVFCQRPAE